MSLSLFGSVSTVDGTCSVGGRVTWGEGHLGGRGTWGGGAPGGGGGGSTPEEVGHG